MNDIPVYVGIAVVVAFCTFGYCMIFGIPALTELGRLKRRARKLHAEITNLNIASVHASHNVLLSYFDSQREGRKEKLMAEFRRVWRRVHDLDPKCPRPPGD